MSEAAITRNREWKKIIKLLYQFERQFWGVRPQAELSGRVRPWAELIQGWDARRGVS